MKDIKKYIEIVQDIVANDYLAPVKTIENQENWICYCGETWPTNELKGLASNLLSNQIREIVVITFNTIDNISVEIVDNLSYTKLNDYYHENYNKTEIDVKSTILTTKNIDFICYKDEENICFSICGNTSLINDVFMGRKYEKMKKVFMKNAVNFSGKNYSLYKYWISFFNSYNSINEYRAKLLP